QRHGHTGEDLRGEGEGEERNDADDDADAAIGGVEADGQHGGRDGGKARNAADEAGEQVAYAHRAQLDIEVEILPGIELDAADIHHGAGGGDDDDEGRVDEAGGD